MADRMQTEGGGSAMSAPKTAPTPPIISAATSAAAKPASSAVGAVQPGIPGDQAGGRWAAGPLRMLGRAGCVSAAGTVVIGSEGRW